MTRPSQPLRLTARDALRYDVPPRDDIAMSTCKPQRNAVSLPATPWGLLPPRMRVLYITTPRRTGAWLAEAFASDSACQVSLDEAIGAAAGLARLREQTYDAVLVEPRARRARRLELLDGLRGGGAEEPLIVLGQPSEQEMAALCYEVGADAYVCVNTATTRTLLWIVARATERHELIRENRRLAQADRHRKSHDTRETERLLSEQRELIRDAEGTQPGSNEASFDGRQMAAIGRRAGGTADAPPIGEPLKSHYRELLRAHVIMGSGNLSTDMAALAELLAAAGVTAPQTMQLHVRSARRTGARTGQPQRAARDDAGRPAGARGAGASGRALSAAALRAARRSAVDVRNWERCRCPTTAPRSMNCASWSTQFVAERQWHQFHTPKNLSMALAIEAAELMEHFQWLDPAEVAGRGRRRRPPRRCGRRAGRRGLLRAGAGQRAWGSTSPTRSATRWSRTPRKYPADQFRGRWGAGDHAARRTGE